MKEINLRVKKRILSYRNKKKIKWIEKVFGYTQQELRNHIYSYHNFNKIKHLRWSVDHKMPVFAFCKYGLTRRSLINHLSNLRPLLTSLNADKGHKYNIKAFWEWVDNKLTEEDIKNMNKQGKIELFTHRFKKLIKEMKESGVSLDLSLDKDQKSDSVISLKDYKLKINISD